MKASVKYHRASSSIVNGTSNHHILSTFFLNFEHQVPHDNAFTEMLERVKTSPVLRREHAEQMEEKRRLNVERKSKDIVDKVLVPARGFLYPALNLVRYIANSQMSCGCYTAVVAPHSLGYGDVGSQSTARKNRHISFVERLGHALSTQPSHHMLARSTVDTIRLPGTQACRGYEDVPQRLSGVLLSFFKRMSGDFWSVRRQRSCVQRYGSLAHCR